MAAAVVAVVSVLLGTAETFTEAGLRKTHATRRLFAPPGSLTASLFLQEDAMAVRFAPETLPVPLPPRRRFRRSEALMRAAKTIEGMVKVMEDKDAAGVPEDPLKTELMLLSQEIHSTLTSDEDKDNTTLTNFINDSSGPVLNNPKEPDVVVEIDEDTTDVSANATAQVFLDRVKEILEGSGIELVLPVDCGRNPLQPRDQLGTTELPWLVALGSREDGRFFYRCPGLIVTNFHVLTDADCTASPNMSGQLPDEEATENFVVGRRIHPDITTLTDLFLGVNVGLLELAEPFLFRDDIQPVCLPGILEEPDPLTAFRGVVAGYTVIPERPATLPSKAGRDAEVYVKEASVYGPVWCRSGVLSADGNPNNTATLLQVLNEKHVCASVDFVETGKAVLLVEDGRTGRVRVMGVGAFANTAHTYPVVFTLVQPHRFWVEVTLKRFLDNTASRVTLVEPEDEQQ
uniref:Peptidase S1 domain-containing protein n=1 Tax=Scylla olivacea TaxID=85551 RepID=A0A0P4W6E4_SCYOL